MKLISLALLLVCGAAHAACPAVVPANKACVSWSASPGWSDGTPYAAGTVVNYTVYLVGPTNTAVVQTTALSYLTPVLPKGQKCYVVTAKVNDPVRGTLESALSNQSCKMIRFPSPTDGKIEGPTDGAIEPK